MKKFYILATVAAVAFQASALHAVKNDLLGESVEALKSRYKIAKKENKGIEKDKRGKDFIQSMATFKFRRAEEEVKKISLLLKTPDAAENLKYFEERLPIKTNALEKADPQNVNSTKERSSAKIKQKQEKCQKEIDFIKAAMQGTLEKQTEYLTRRAAKLIANMEKFNKKLVEIGYDSAIEQN